jgi:hypothetical protein
MIQETTTSINDGTNQRIFTAGRSESCATKTKCEVEKTSERCAAILSEAVQAAQATSAGYLGLRRRQGD